MLFPVSRSFIQYFSHSFADVSTFLCSKYLSICANCIALLCIWLLHYNTKHIPIRTETKMSVNESEWKKKYQHTKTKQQQQQQWISTDVSISCWMNEIGIGHKGRTTMLLMLCFCCCVYLCIFCVFDHFHFSCSSILWLRRCSRFRRLFLCVLYAPTIDIANSIDFAHGISAHTPNTHTHSALSFSILTVCMGRYLQRLTIHFIRNWSYSYFLLRFVSLLSVPLFDHVASGIFSRRQTNFSHIHT